MEYLMIGWILRGSKTIGILHDYFRTDVESSVQSGKSDPE